MVEEMQSLNKKLDETVSSTCYLYYPYVTICSFIWPKYPDCNTSPEVILEEYFHFSYLLAPLLNNKLQKELIQQVLYFVLLYHVNDFSSVYTVYTAHYGDI